MKIRAQKHDLKYWQALPIPKKWRVLENNGDEEENKKERLEKSIWKEWISAHPMDGD